MHSGLVICYGASVCLAKTIHYTVIRFAVELEHARVKGLCPSGRRRCSKSRHSKCAIIRALAFEETRRAKNILNIWRNRKEWVHDILAFGATVYVLFFPFQGIAKLALGIEWVVQVQVPNTMWIRQDGRKVTKRKDSKTLRC